MYRIGQQVWIKNPGHSGPGTVVQRNRRNRKAEYLVETDSGTSYLCGSSSLRAIKRINCTDCGEDVVPAMERCNGCGGFKVQHDYSGGPEPCIDCGGLGHTDIPDEVCGACQEARLETEIDAGIYP